MKSLILYYSTYGNHTKQLAELFGRMLKADLISLRNTRDIDIEQYDLIGFGSGIYHESMAPQIFRCAEQLKLEKKDVFIFSTSGVGMTFYNKRLIKLCKEKGANCRGSFACKGSFQSKDFCENKVFELMGNLSQGHPSSKDIRKAERFIDRVMCGRQI